MCFAHYDTHCCQHCLLPLFTDPRPSSYEPCFSSVCYGRGVVGNCVQRGVQRHDTNRYDSSCVDCNPAYYNDLARATRPSAAVPPSAEPLEAAQTAEAASSGLWDSSDGADDPPKRSSETLRRTVEMALRRVTRRSRGKEGEGRKMVSGCVLL